MTTNDIRSRYLNYFKEKEHAILPSASLLPDNDPTTLFTGSGMQPMVPFLLGESHAQGTRLADSQKCFRSNDIEEVGDNRHTTFFEMLGNWSLGSYFKEEQISWMFDFLIHDLQLNPKQLYITAFRGNDELGIEKDEEAAKLWQAQFASVGMEAPIVDNSETKGMQGGRIFYYDESKNWWSRAGVPNKMPAGEPGGPDTEMFFDFAPERGDKHLYDGQEAEFGEKCHVNCDCGRFIEIGNNVFMQYQRTKDGFSQLPQKNVDFGGGLERLAAAVINDPDIFNIDLFTNAKAAIADVSGKTYGSSEEVTYAYRVMLDHLRAAVFLISDGAFPANKDQGYFTRRLIRRAVRYGTKLGIESQIAQTVGAAFIDQYQAAYPALKEQRDAILKSLDDEEAKFRKAMIRAKKELKKVEATLLASVAQLPSTDKAVINPIMQLAFDLFQTHGLPLEVFFDELDTLGAEGKYNDNVLMEVYDEIFKGHQQLSREASEQKFKGGLADHSDMSVKYHTATHLLHAALRQVLGDHVEQKGSNITPERLRFDFSHGEKMTPEQKEAVEALVNAAIAQDYVVSYQELPLEEAKKKEAIGLFDDQYGDVVKVYTIGDPEGMPQAQAGAATFSREFCGGPHVERTGNMGHFRIKKEEASSAGVRRIKAILE